MFQISIKHLYMKIMFIIAVNNTQKMHLKCCHIWKVFQISSFLWLLIHSLAVALRRDHSQMWPKLGDGDSADGEKPRLCVYMLSGNSTVV